MSDNKKGFDSWAILELMGHRQLVGKLVEEEVAGQLMLRIDILDPDGGPDFKATQYYSASAVYAITPVSEIFARKIRTWNRSTPVFMLDIQSDGQIQKLGARALRGEEDGDEDYG